MTLGISIRIADYVLLLMLFNLGFARFASAVTQLKGGEDSLASQPLHIQVHHQPQHICSHAEPELNAKQRNFSSRYIATSLSCGRMPQFDLKVVLLTFW
jgi:hypothetical protein